LQENKITLLGQRIKNTGRVHVFPLLLLVFIFFLEIHFEAPHEKNYFLSPSFAALIQVLNVVFHLGLQNKFPRNK
jgi:hypothetical protein